MPEGNRSRDPLLKGLHLLRWLMINSQTLVGVREAAEALNVPPSGAHRLLTGLVNAGFMTHHPELGKYSLTLEFYRLAQLTAGRTPFQRVAVPHLRDLVQACNEAAFFSLYDEHRQEMITVASAESTHALRYVVEINSWKPVYAGASGLAILAFLPDEERKTIIARTQLRPLTEATIVDPAQLERELLKVRRRGYACTRGQRIPGAVGIAAPVFGPTGAVIGDVGLTIPEQRFESREECELSALLISCSEAIMAETGGLKPKPNKLTALPLSEFSLPQGFIQNRNGTPGRRKNPLRNDFARSQRRSRAKS